jgi:glycosyltransferase involved in cell wall biosynthesis
VGGRECLLASAQLAEIDVTRAASYGEFMSLRLAYVTSHPIQYQAGLFRELSKSPDITFKAFFASRMGLESYFDPGFGKALKWDVPLLDGFDYAFTPNLSRKGGVDGFSALVNPTMSLELRRWGADVVIVHGYAHATMVMTIAACRLLKIPTLIRGESHLLPLRTRPTRLVKAAASFVARRSLAGAIAIGSLNAEYWRFYGIPDERIFFAPYVVDNAYFQGHAESARERAQVWRQELGLSPETIVVGYAAKLSKVKDCGTLISAFGKANVPNTALVIVGDGPLRNELEALAASFPNAKIHFAGFLNQSEMPSAYAISDLFALPSNFEPWGLVVNEAMNLGCPLVVTDAVGSAPDLVGPDNGWVFPTGDSDTLAAIFREALGRSDARERLAEMGEASRQRIARWGLPEAAAGIIEAAKAVAPSRS